MMEFLRSDWFTNAAGVVLFAWSARSLARSIVARDKDSAKLHGVTTLAFGLMLCVPLTFHFFPALLPPKPWRPTNLWYLLRWPGILFFVVSALIVYRFILDKRLKRKSI